MINYYIKNFNVVYLRHSNFFKLRRCLGTSDIIVVSAIIIGMDSGGGYSEVGGGGGGEGEGGGGSGEGSDVIGGLVTS